jgi:hypothetical protein
MGPNGFREDELVGRRVKVGNEWQTKVFPIIGGRLRIIHETSSRINIATEILKLEPDFAVVRATLESEKGKFCGTGTASAQRNACLADSLVELAETRAIARSLRFGGIGVEFTSAEEVSHVATAEPEREQTTHKQGAPVFPGGNGNDKPQTKAQNTASYGEQSKPSHDAIDPSTTDEPRPSSEAGADNGSKPYRCGIGLATQAQCRALYALNKRANYTSEDVESLLKALYVSSFQDLTREDASWVLQKGTHPPL